MPDLLTKKVLQSSGDDGAAIVLARVQRVRLDAAGSRSEAAVFTLRVDQVLCGSSPGSLTVWRYTSGKSSLHGLRKMLQQGQTYVIAFERAPRAWPAPYALIDFALVLEGGEVETVEAHLEILRQVNAPQPVVLPRGARLTDT